MPISLGSRKPTDECLQRLVLKDRADCPHQILSLCCRELWAEYDATGESPRLDPKDSRPRRDKLYATIASASSAGRVVSLNVTGSVSLTT